MLALVLLPWTAARVIATERGDDFVGLSAVTAIPPSRVLLARLLAAAVALGLVVAGAVPVGHQRPTDVRDSRHRDSIADQLALLTFALPVAVVTVWWMQLAADRLLGWLGAAATTSFS